MKTGSARYRRIILFAGRQLVLLWWTELVLPRLGLAALARRGRERRMTRIASRFRELALELGGLMIKIGQFLSSRLDVLPPEVTRELATLQDEVPPVDFARIRELAETELGMPLERAFASVDPAPLAAASLGQVHRAVLHPRDAQEQGFSAAVVKVQRPGIDEIVAIDLSALRRVARWLRRVRVIADRVDAPALVEEFATTCGEEIDYLHEAGNAELFAENAAGNPLVDAPAVVWERTTRRVLTLHDVTAIKISDVPALHAAGIDPSEVAAEFARTMFTQLFVDGFFHADPHPGNVFVTPLPDQDPHWRLTFVDFGMMGEISDSLRGGLRRILIAIAARDGAGLIAGARDIGALLPSADTAQLERAMTTLFDRFGGMGVSQLREVDPREFRDFAKEFGEIARTLPFQFPENFLLVVRAISLISGVCSTLDPEFNIWDAVEPYAQQLLRDESAGFARDILGRLGTDLGLALQLPRRIDEAVARIEAGRLAVETPALERRVARLERTARRVVSGVLFAGLLIAGAVLLPVEPVLGTWLMAVSGLPLLHALFAGLGGRRR